MPNNDYANEPNQSRSEEIIQSILDNTEYDEAARSRIEYLLIELKNAIEGGGGGGGVTSYSPLTEKPKIDNHTLQAGNNTSSDLGLQTKLTFDSAPTENSTNPVTSGGVYTALGTKANSSDVYNKSAVDTALGAKADKSTTYTKAEVDTALGSKQNTISDLSTIRSGAALGATAVQPVSGKGLSTNDYTTAEKNKLAGIEAQANKTTVDSTLSGSSTNPVQNKVVKSALDGKQDALSTEQLAAVNSGITDDDVEQIDLNKNNILYNTDNGVKNVVNINTNFATFTTGGITFTDNHNSTINVNGTSTNADVYVQLYNVNSDNLFGFKIGETVVITTTSNTVALQIIPKRTDGYGATVFGTKLSPAIYTIPSNFTGFLLRVGVIATGTHVDNEDVGGMICVKSLYDADPTYQPYAMNNAELTAAIKALQAQLANQ